MKSLLLLLVQLWIMLLVAHANPFVPPQTPEEVQQQKNHAQQQVVENVPSDFRTPLAVFEMFYAGLVAGDASEYSCFTSKLIEEIFESGELTPESLQRLRNGRTDREERDHMLGEFRFKEHPDRPEITLTYTHSYKDANERFWTVDRMRLMLIRTPQGWKIDEIEDDLPVK